MKAKVNIPSRGKSNPPLKNLPPSALLEEETKRMEQRLKELKDVMAEQAAKRGDLASGEGTRWKSANQNMPIKNYAKTVLENKGKAPVLLNNKGNKDNLSGTLNRTNPAKPTREKMPPSREKIPTINTVTSSTPRDGSQKNKENESQKDFFRDNNMISAPTSSTSASGSNIRLSTKTQKQQPIPQVEESKSVENNINKALAKEKEATTEVGKFLQENGLPQYIQVFHENGFDDLETVMEIQTKHLVEMKIPAGHQIKLSKRIEALRQNYQSTQNSAPSSQKTTANATTSGTNTTQNKVAREVSYTKNDYVQLEEPTKEQGIGDERAGGELSGGAYNEAESHKSFLEALNEWRSGKAQPENERKESRAKDSRNKKVRFAEPDDNTKEAEKASAKEPQKKEEKKPFYFSGEGSWDSAKLPGQKESATDMSPREAQASQKAKVSCWHCYRLVSDDELQFIGKRQFCSDQCVKAYRDINSTKCMKKGCEQLFLKEEGVMREGRWYCSEKCAPSMEEILMEEQRMLRRLAQENKDSANNFKEEEGNEEEQRITEGSGQEASEENGEEPQEYDLNVDRSNKKEVLTLAELEEKYKNFNEVAEKADGGENELEDSLN